MAISAPTATTQWTRGTSYVVQWASTGAIGTLTLTLQKSGMSDVVLSSTETNDGTYTISSGSTTSLTAGAGYTVFITDGSTSVTSFSFAVVDVPPSKSITVQTPSTCVQNTACSIAYSATGGVTTVGLTFSGASSGTVVASTTDNPYFWAVPGNIAPGTYYVAGTDTSDSNVNGISGSFTVEAAPAIDIHLPTTATTWVHGSIGPVVWTTEGAMAGAATIQIMKAGMATIDINADNDGSYDVAISVVNTLAPGGGYTVRIVVDSVTVTSQSFSVVFADRVVVGAMPVHGCTAGQDCVIPWTTEGTVTTVKINHLRMSGGMASTELAASTLTNPYVCVVVSLCRCVVVSWCCCVVVLLYFGLVFISMSCLFAT